MRYIITAATAALLGLGAIAPAFAESPECTQPKSAWKPVEELKAKLSADGWTISNVKTDEGCYEVYAKDKNGKKVEVYFDPVTFEKVGEDN